MRRRGLFLQKNSGLGDAQDFLNRGDPLQHLVNAILVKRGHALSLRHIFDLMGIMGFEYQVL